MSAANLTNARNEGISVVCLKVECAHVTSFVLQPHVMTGSGLNHEILVDRYFDYSGSGIYLIVKDNKIFTPPSSVLRLIGVILFDPQANALGLASPDFLEPKTLCWRVTYSFLRFTKTQRKIICLGFPESWERATVAVSTLNIVPLRKAVFNEMYLQYKSDLLIFSCPAPIDKF